MSKFITRIIGCLLVIGLVVIVPIGFSTYSYAKERKHGAQVLIQKNDGQTLKGELLAVKEDKLILMDSVSLGGISVSVQDVMSVTIVKKSKFFQGLGLGFLTGGGTGVLLGFLSGDDPPGWFSWTAGQKALLGGLALGILGVPIGGIYGAAKGVDEKVYLDEKSPEQVKLVMLKLSSKSRFPDEFPQNIKIGASMSSVIEVYSNNNVGSYEKATATRPESQKRKSGSMFSRIHLTYKPGYFHSQGVGDYMNFFQSIGFGDTKPGGEVILFWFSFGSYGPTEFPQESKNPVIYFQDIRLDVSISRKFALGVGYSPLGEHEVCGYKYIPIFRKGREYYSDLYLIGNFSGNLYYISGSWMPIPDAFLKKSSVKLGVSVGMSNTRVNFTASQRNSTEAGGEKIKMTKMGLALSSFGELDYYFSRNWSVGINVEYKYVPARIDAFKMTGYYQNLDENNNLIDSPLQFDVPSHKVNFGGWGFGMTFGLHF